MPKYDKAVLTGQARQLGFLMAPFEKMTRLAEILRFLNETVELREMLALKGGTAINLAVFDLPRLSVDIDLDFAMNLTREETKIKRDRINELLELYMKSEGYTLKGKSKNTYILDSFVYSYTNAAGNSDNIKVEINYSLRSHVLPVVDMNVRTSEIFAPFPVRILAPVEIFASKIVALCDRAAARDLYDLNNMVYYTRRRKDMRGTNAGAIPPPLRRSPSLYQGRQREQSPRAFPNRATIASQVGKPVVKWGENGRKLPCYRGFPRTVGPGKRQNNGLAFIHGHIHVSRQVFPNMPVFYPHHTSPRETPWFCFRQHRHGRRR